MFIQYLSMIMHDYLWHEPNFVINKVWKCKPGHTFDLCLSPGLATYLCWNMHVGKGTGCHAGIIHWQRCCTRGESQGTYITHLHKVWIRLPTLASKPRGHITRSPKQGYQWPYKWKCVQQIFFFKKSMNMYFYSWKYLLLCPWP